VAKTAARIRSRRLIRGYGIAVLRLSKFPFHEMINANQRFLKNNARQQANRTLALSLRSNGSPAEPLRDDSSTALTNLTPSTPSEIPGTRSESGFGGRFSRLAVICRPGRCTVGRTPPNILPDGRWGCAWHGRQRGQCRHCRVGLYVAAPLRARNSIRWDPPGAIQARLFPHMPADANVFISGCNLTCPEPSLCSFRKSQHHLNVVVETPTGYERSYIGRY